MCKYETASMWRVRCRDSGEEHESQYLPGLDRHDRNASFVAHRLVRYGSGRSLTGAIPVEDDGFDVLLRILRRQVVPEVTDSGKLCKNGTAATGIVRGRDGDPLQR